MTALLAILRRDFVLAFRSGGGWFYALFFFAVFTALSAIAFGPSLSALAIAAPATLWLAIALSVQFSAADLYENDIRDGSLRVIAAEQLSLLSYWGAKVCVLMITAVVPMIATAPFFLTMLGLSFGQGVILAIILFMGAPALVFIAVMTAALASGLRAGGLLAMIIAVPFSVPVLVFAVRASKSVLAGSGLVTPESLILCAISLFMAVLTPGFTIAALRVSLE
ncbi:heme exporter protein CcmB [Hyphococcus formosus]|uniref:heme exporter protein CcmB n=1 Tax=Hyphococcus formosus TaxID=3143534 RepID=UPI00398AEF5B